MREKICFLQQSGIGNLVLSTPMLKAIKIAKPSCELIVITWNRSIRILEGVEFIDNLLSMDQGTVIMKNLEPYVDYTILSPVGLHDGVVEEVVKMSKNVMSSKINGVWAKHESEYHMDFAKKLGFIGNSPTPEVAIFEYNKEECNEFLKNINVVNNFICINIGYLKNDHWPAKFWGHENFYNLIDIIKNNYNLDIILIGGSHDRKDADIILDINKEKHKIYNATGKFEDIKTTAALMAMSKMVIGSDGGNQHIASALNVPTITIFTFTNPIKNRPLGNLARTVMIPCNNRIYCQHRIDKLNECRNNGCFNVSPNMVFSKVKELLSDC